MIPLPLAMRAAKDELRQEMRDRRLSLAPARARELSERATAHVRALPEYAAARVVALYAPMRGEIDTGPLARDLRSRGVVVCYPCVAQGHRVLAFHDVPDEALLRPSRLGIPEPTEDMPRVLLTSIDVVVVPGLAFDEAGGRLGWGLAYYDNTLAAALQALRIGLAFELQIVPAVPLAADDERVDVICTETGARRTRARERAKPA